MEEDCFTEPHTSNKHVSLKSSRHMTIKELFYTDDIEIHIYDIENVKRIL